MGKFATTPIGFQWQDDAIGPEGASHRTSGFVLEGLPSEVAPGLYRLTLDTDRPAADLDLATLHFDFVQPGAEDRVHLSFERKGRTLVAYFVVTKPARTVVLLPFASFDAAAQRATIRRVSTSLYRLRRAAAALSGGRESIDAILGNVRDLLDAYRTGGRSAARKHAERLMAPTNHLMGGDARELNFPSFWRRQERQTQAVLDEPQHWSGGGHRERPSFSIVVPVFRTNPEWLGTLLDSLCDQSDPNFEVVFVLDGPQPELQTLLERRSGALESAVIVVLPENEGVSAATNAGMRRAKGDYLCVVDHDDRLARGFVEAFRRAAEARSADILYADEVIADAAMNRVLDVASRGAFDLRFYLSHPYIVHPVAIRRATALEAGLFDPQLTVSQDVDYLLRCILHARNVVHIPLVLYAWRTHPGSLGHARRDEVTRNTLAAVRRFLDATPGGADFQVESSDVYNVTQVRPPVPEGVRAAILIPTKNRHEILGMCLRSIEARRAANTVPFTVFVIDHESHEPETLELLARESAAGRIEVLPHAGPWNYAAINNAAVRRIEVLGGYTHLVFMNNDIEIVTDNWLDRMTALCSWPDAGVVGCRLLYPDGRIQHAGVIVGLTGGAEHSHKFVDDRRADGDREAGYLCSLAATRGYDAVTAAMMLVPAEAFRRVGGFDEDLAVGFNDTDLCLRIGALGLASIYAGDVCALHFESASRGHSRHDPHPTDTARFVERYADEIRHGDRHWGQLMNWHDPRPTIALIRQKAFTLRETSVRLP